jgi:DNA-binding MarR family transcriptional regulator
MRRIDLAATKQCHCLAARRKARAITRLYEEKLRPHGLRASQFSILAVLSLKGPTLITQIADILGLERTTVTRSAALLKRNGWVRDARANDARERPLALTAAGRRKLEGAYPAWKSVQDRLNRRSEARAS